MSNWDKRHGKILQNLIGEFKKAGIRYFILRNYEGLPNENKSKDVDIIIDPKKVREANNTIESIYRINNLTHCYKVRFTNVYCWHGMDIDNRLSIHIDLIAGYNVKGYEVFNFKELYQQTTEYNEFRVLNRYYEGLMVFIYKQFGYIKPQLKQEYKDIIYSTYCQNIEFTTDLQTIVGQPLANNIISAIAEKDFDKMLSYSQQLTAQLKLYSFKKDPIGVLFRIIEFYWLKFQRIILCRKRYGKSFSVMAPDGAGKTTFLEALLDDLAFYFTKDSSYFTLLHFRPEILPNLGAVGEKAGLMKQDKNFTTPHRAKPAGLLSSLFRITYYWCDYVLGWFFYTSKDIQYDRFTVFDRYSYDLIVDPKRTRLSLPCWIRKLYVMLMPHPKLVFYLDVEPDEIFRRKKELTLMEINRQVNEYRKILKLSKRFVVLDGNLPVDQVKKEAVKLIVDYYAKRIG